MRLCKAKPCRNTIPKGSPKFVRWCSPECGARLAMLALEKKKAKAQKAEKLDRIQKVKNFRLKDITRQKDLTQAACNKLASLLDKGLPCISCGRPDEGGRKRNASHYKSKGSNSYLRYNLRNLHMSCVVCNLHQSGNIQGYTQGLTDRYGQGIVDYLETAPRLREWEPEELVAMRREFNAEIRRIERGEGASRDWRKV